MPTKTKVRVLKGGAPLTGIHVLVAPLVGTDQVTDEDGRVAFDWPSTSSGWVIIHVWGEAIGDSSAVTRLVDLECHDFDVQPAPE